MTFEFKNKVCEPVLIFYRAEFAVTENPIVYPEFVIIPTILKYRQNFKVCQFPGEPPVCSSSFHLSCLGLNSLSGPSVTSDEPVIRNV